MSTTTTLWICTDCAQFAHGISADERGEEYPAAVTAAFSDPARGLGGMGRLTPGTLEHDRECIDPETGDLDPVELCTCDYLPFTFAHCEACLSPLGGDRRAFTLWDN